MFYSLTNLPYWIILGLGVLLFLIAISVGGGDDDIDGNDLFDLDADTDVDVEVDGDIRLPLLLGWFGIGKVPLILLLATDLCFWGLTGWLLNAIAFHFLGFIPVTIIGWGGIIFLTSFWLGLQIGGLIARPLGKLFASFGQDVSSDRLIGCLGTVSSKTIPRITEGKIGQVDVSDPSNNLVTVGATIPEWVTIIPQRGQQIIVIDRRKNSYIVLAKDTSDEDRWLANSDVTKDTHSH
ncbi:MAG: DUF1449 domain-containing protein [Cyanobacteria bacterium P01_E01_bin.42]